MRAKKVLFVCTGNTCRSPMAEALLRARVKDEIEVKSAGVHAFPNGSASEGTMAVLAEKEINHHHLAQSVSEDLIQWADIVLTMTQTHKKMILHEHPEKAEQIKTLKEFADPRTSELDIIDPFGGSIEEYRQTAVQIESCLDEVVRKLIGN